MPMKTREVIHIVCEVIILSAISYAFNKRLKKLAENVEDLKKENKELKLELDEVKKLLSLIMMPPGSPAMHEQGTEGARYFTIPIPSGQPSNFETGHPSFTPAQRNIQKGHVIFHPLSPIEEEEECDDERCRLGISELQEEGSMLASPDETPLDTGTWSKRDSQNEEGREISSDTATIIFSTISNPPKKESTAKLEVIENIPQSNTEQISTHGRIPDSFTSIPEGNSLAKLEHNVPEESRKPPNSKTSDIIKNTVSSNPSDSNSSSSSDIIRPTNAERAVLATASSTSPFVSSASVSVSPSTSSGATSISIPQSVSSGITSPISNISNAKNGPITENEKLKVIDPKKVKLLRKKKNGN
jgi:hypothetical protein